MLNKPENYSMVEVEQAKRYIRNLVKEKSILIRLNLSKTEDIYSFLED